MNLKNRQDSGIARKYFDGLAERFPVMCASDEFHFLPRAGKAADFYGRLDNLDRDAVSDAVVFLKDIQKELDALVIETSDPETLADLELLKANNSGVLIELEQNRSWRHNPLLYLKIAFIGVDHSLNKPSATTAETVERFSARLQAFPHLLQQAVQNIRFIPEANHKASLCMIADGAAYLGELVSATTTGPLENIRSAFKTAQESLAEFRDFIQSIPPTPDSQLGNDSLKHSLENHFVVGRKPEEVFEIAVHDWQENLCELEKLGRKIDPGSSWQEVYHNYQPSESTAEDTLQLYSAETDRLFQFFRNIGLSDAGLKSPVSMAETPTYLRSVRGTASFAAALSRDERELSFFYITTSLPGQNRTHESNLLRRRFHREYRFLTAHETIPGHHYLDTIRRNLVSPVRRQIESPLFYEGWASYAESLVTETGYAAEPIDFLIEHKRRLWRAARCQVDIGLPFGFMNEEKALQLLNTAGFSDAEAMRQINRFQLNPGYQVCYCLGRFEMMRLRNRFIGSLGHERFHAEVLQGGELPFHLLDRRLSRICHPDS